MVRDLLSTRNRYETEANLARIQPWDASSPEMLDAACEFAASQLYEIAQDMLRSKMEVYGFHAKVEVTRDEVGFILKRLLKHRTRWLKEHGAYNQNGWRDAVTTNVV